MDERTQIIDLAIAYETLHGLGLFDYAGDVSVRANEAHYFIRSARVSLTARDAGSRVRTSPDDIIRLDLADQLVHGEGAIPIEAPLHGAIYATRPDVGSIVHCHPKMTTVLSVAGVMPRPVFIRGAELTGPGLRVFPQSDPIRTRSEGQKLAGSLGESDACLLPAHGVVVVGRTIAQACMGVINLEQSASVQFLASLVGKPRDLPAASIDGRTRINETPEFFAATWAYYCELVANRVSRDPSTLA